MNIRDIITMQHDFDHKHGWTFDIKDVDKLIHFLNRDVVGLLGEIGEIANVIKKMNLDYDSNKINEELFADYKSKLREEVVDAFVYLLRLTSSLELDIENAYLSKLEVNKKRFLKYEVNK